MKTRSLFLTLVFVSLPVWAATPTNETQIAKSDAAPLGWSKSANLGVNLSFSSSQDVVGQTNGSSQAYGVDLKGSLNRHGQSDDWQNNLAISQTTTKTPNVPGFVKSNDDLKLDTTYLYSLPRAPHWGPYVKGEVDTSVFKGEDVRPANQTYVVNYRHKSAETVQGSSLRLTDGFKPLTTRESVGGFWKPIDRKNLKIEGKVGVAAMQIAADGQLAVQGTDANGNIEVNELRDLRQLGTEVGLSIKGVINPTSSYEIAAETLTPFISNKEPGDHRDDWQLTNVDASVKLSSNITSWASFSYNYKLKVQPELVDRAQQTHMIVLNLNYNLL